MTDTTNDLVVTVIPNDENRHAYARFTWRFENDTCDMVSVGMEQDEIDAIIDARAHEGVNLDGFTVEMA